MKTNPSSVEPLESRIAPANAAVVELSSLTGTNGFQISGEMGGDFSGRSLSAAGDVNGDGIDDVIIGANLASPSGAGSGAAYVVFGTKNGFPANLDLSALTGANGFQINGVAAGDYAGRSVSAAGDVNGDGFDDVIIGADGADPNGLPGAGASYVVFGAPTFAATLNLSALAGSNGFKVSGEATSDAAGRAVSAAGDINGDGFDDVIIGAEHATGGAANSGASYVIFGHEGAFVANLNLNALNGSNGFKIAGAATNDFFGHSVSAAGDVNGDGFDDVIIGAYHASGDVADSGASYVLFGKGTSFGGSAAIAALDGTTGFKVSGVTAGDFTGYSTSGAGDVNGDGFDDVIVGAVFADPNGISSGTSYVVFGRTGGFTANLDLSTLDGITGFKVSGEATLDFAGTSVSRAGDVNGDGFDDLHIGANGLDTHGIYTGASYVVYGRSGGFTANLNLSTLDGRNGFQINGEASGDFAGSSVSNAGDVNGDGFADVFIASRFASPHGGASGATYVVFGQGTSVEPTLSADHKTATFIDSDGDRVTVKTTKGDLTGKLTLFASGVGARLETLDLRDAQFDNASVAVTAVKAGAGDGLVNVGLIEATGRDLGRVTVKGDLGEIDCGDGDFSDPSLRLLSVRSMGLYGQTLGAPDLKSEITGTLVALKVAGDFTGASISASGGLNGKIGSVTIGGSLIAGASGGISTSGDMGLVKIGHDLLGGTADNSGAILSQGKLGSVIIGGSLIGGSGRASARIFSAGDMGVVKIGHDVIGGTGDLSGSIDCNGLITSVMIGGSLLGGSAGYFYTDPSFISHEGQVFAVGKISSVKVGRDVIDGTGFASAEIRSYDGLGAVTIGGSLIGGSGFAGGHIATGTFGHPGDMGPVKIGGDVIGGPSAYTGHIESFGRLASVTIGGSLIGGTSTITMGSNFQTGAITSNDDMGAVKIGGDVRGGSISGTQPSLSNSAFITGDRIASVFIGGSIITGVDSSTGGDLANNAAIRANDDIGAIVVKGSLVGHSTSKGASPVVISARGQETVAPDATSDIAIKSIKIGGRVELAKILAGFALFDPDTTGSNGNASIGAVTIGGDWIASSLVAGVKDDGNAGFGDGGDAVINSTGDTLIAKIASIAIKGIVFGSTANDDHFGIVAQQIGSFKAAGFTAPLSSGAGEFFDLSPSTGDVTLREV